ncbi:unnamed protein product, partial [Nesidiocoris tenuis]
MAQLARRIYTFQICLRARNVTGTNDFVTLDLITVVFGNLDNKRILLRRLCVWQVIGYLD